MKALSRPLRRAMAAAATLTGKRFGLLVASSLVATSAIVAAAMTGSHDIGPLAGLIGRSLAADRTPAASAPAPEPAATPSGPTAHPAASSSPGAPSPATAPAPEASPASEPAPPPPTPAPAPETSLPEAGRVKHVFVVSLASPGYEAAFGSSSRMPYLASTLRPKGDLLSGYSLLGEAALANSIAALSGQPPNADTSADCPAYTEFPSTAKADAKGIVAGSGCVYPVETLTVADQLGSARFSWRAYVDGMADETGKAENCVHPEPGAAEEPAPGAYSARLNPFVHFHSLLDLGDCASNDVPLAELDKDLKAPESAPTYSYIAPNPCDAGLTGQCPAGSAEGATAADAFLAEVVPKILASPAYRRDGLLIVAFGELSPPAPTDPAAATPATPPADPLKVGALLVSRFLTPGSTDPVPYNPYSLLRSSEDLFGLTHLAGAGGAKVRSFAPALLGENGGD